MERSGRRGWNSLVAWFGCGQEGFGVGRSCEGGERGFGAFYRPAEEGSSRGRRLAERKLAVVHYQEEVGYKRGCDGTSTVMGREEDEVAWLGWASHAEEGGTVVAAAWPSAGGRRRGSGLSWAERLGGPDDRVDH
jgi:hypothetical protein